MAIREGGKWRYLWGWKSYFEVFIGFNCSLKTEYFVLKKFIDTYH
jgi:hypothetical protein